MEEWLVHVGARSYRRAKPRAPVVPCEQRKSLNDCNGLQFGGPNGWGSG